MNRPCVVPMSDGRCALLVAVLPNAPRAEVVGLHDGALRVRLAAPPVDGRANAALVAWLADELRLSRRDVDLKQGVSGRRKRLVLACDAARVEGWLDALGVARHG